MIHGLASASSAGPPYIEASGAGRFKMASFLGAVVGAGHWVGTSVLFHDSLGKVSVGQSEICKVSKGLGSHTITSVILFFSFF